MTHENDVNERAQTTASENDTSAVTAGWASAYEDDGGAQPDGSESAASIVAPPEEDNQSVQEASDIALELKLKDTDILQLEPNGPFRLRLNDTDVLPDEELNHTDILQLTVEGTNVVLRVQRGNELLVSQKLKDMIILHLKDTDILQLEDTDILQLKDTDILQLTRQSTVGSQLKDTDILQLKGTDILLKWQREPNH